MWARIFGPRTSPGVPLALIVAFSLILLVACSGSRSITREEEGEILIVISSSRGSSLLTESLEKDLRDIGKGQGIANLRIERTSSVVTSEEKAREIAGSANASIVVWEQESGDRSTVSILNLKATRFERLAFPISRSNLLASVDSSAGKLEIEDGQSVVRFLGLVALAHSLELRTDWEAVERVLGLALSEQEDVGQDLVFDALFLLGLAQQQLGDLTEAESSYTSALELKSDVPEVLNNRGVVRALQGKLTPALTDFDKAIQLDASYAEALSNRGGAEVGLCRSEEGKAALDAALSIDPGLAVALGNRGSARLSTGDTAGALEDLNRAIEIDRTVANFFANRGTALAIDGDYERAFADFGLAESLDAQSGSVFGNRGNALMFQGRYEEALEQLDRAVTLDSNSIANYYNRGLAHANLGENGEAVLDYSQAISLLSGPSVEATFCPVTALQRPMGQFLYDRGNAYLNQQMLSEALEDFLAAEDLGLVRPELFNNLGVVHTNMHEFALAVDYYSRSIELDASYLLAYPNRAESYACLGEMGAAREDLVFYLGMITADQSLAGSVQSQIDAIDTGDNPFEACG